MKFVITLLVLITLSLKAQNPYATLAYDSLVIYDYGDNMRGEPGSNIYKKGKCILLYNQTGKKSKTYYW